MSIFNKPLKPWLNVIGSVLAHGSGTVVLVYTFSMFVKPIAVNLGLDRGAVGLSFSFFLVANGIGCLGLGSTMSRWGIRRTILLWTALYGAALMSLAFIPPSLLILYLAFAVIGYFGAVGSAQPYAVIICAWFDRRRGLALAILAAGAGLGIVVIPPVVNHIMMQHGWRMAYVAIGVIDVAVVFSVLLFLIRLPPGFGDARERKLQPTEALGYRQLLRVRDLWLIGLPIFGASMALFGFTGSTVAIMTDRGWSPSAAAAIIPVFGISSMSAKFLAGYLLDKIFVRHIANFVFAIALIGVICALNIGSGPNIIAVMAVACIGFTQGSESDIVTYMASRYFSPQDYSRAVGAMFFAWTWGAAAGNGVSNLSFHMTNSYESALWFFIGILILSIAIISQLGRYKYGQGAVISGMAEIDQAGSGG